MSVEIPLLQLLQEKFKIAVKDKTNGKVNVRSCKVDVFIQTWGSTGIGLNPIGGQSMTDAYTTVITDDNSEWCGVFFDKELAYLIDEPNADFYEDLKNRQMEPVWEHHKYINKGI